MYSVWRIQATGKHATGKEVAVWEMLVAKYVIAARKFAIPEWPGVS
jgi:hypothetical protein